MALLLLDNYDSFTYILRDYLEQGGCQVQVLRNDEIDMATTDFSIYEGVVLSPGPKTPAQSGSLMEVVSKVYTLKPLLGICLGHQAIGEFLGSRLAHSTQPWHGKQTEVMHTNHPMFKDVTKQFMVGRYHSLTLYDIPASLEITAMAKDGDVMAIAHREYPVWGIQFHPESCLTPQGLLIIRNWIDHCIRGQG